MRESRNEPIAATQGRDDSVLYSWQATVRKMIGIMIIL